MKSRPYPWWCGACKQKSINPITIPYLATILHNGRLVPVTIASLKVNKCSICKEIWFDLETDAQINIAYKEQYPEE